MQRQRLSLEEALVIAENAKDYARNLILKGGSQIENNDLPRNRAYALTYAVEEGTRPLMAALTSLSIEKNMIIHNYESVIDVTTKFSLGNCAELATQALDYILYHTTNIEGELYEIAGGDHVFLVINRDPKSHPAHPDTWGKNAVICDPWSNEIYPASDYLKKLKNYFFLERTSRVEDFDPRRHQLKPLLNLNSTYLRTHRNTNHLQPNLIERIKSLASAVIDYQSKLTHLMNRLILKYGNGDNRIPIIANKIELLTNYVKILEDKMNEIQQKKYPEEYRLAKKEMTNELKKIIAKTVAEMQFSKNDHIILFEHKGKDKMTSLMKFFKISNKTQSQLENLTDEINQMIFKR